MLDKSKHDQYDLMVKPLFENCVSFIHKMHLPGYKNP